MKLTIATVVIASICATGNPCRCPCSSKTLSTPINEQWQRKRIHSELEAGLCDCPVHNSRYGVRPYLPMLPGSPYGSCCRNLRCNRAFHNLAGTPKAAFRVQDQHHQECLFISHVGPARVSDTIPAWRPRSGRMSVHSHRRTDAPGHWDGPRFRQPRSHGPRPRDGLG